jgi:hypothetical protein
LDEYATAYDTLPLLFLILVSEGNCPSVKAIHHGLKKPRALWPTPHDGRTFTFVGEVLPGQTIDMATLPRDMFPVIPDVEVPTVAQTEVAVSSLPPGTEDLAEPGVAGDTETVTVRCAVPVPHCLLNLVLSAEYTPRTL